MSAPAVRREVQELAAVLRRAGLIKQAGGLYARVPRTSSTADYAARARAMAHELDTLAAIVARLDQLTAPKAPPAPKLPGEGTAARLVLVLLEANRRGMDHDHVRMLTGLTDAELCGRVTGAGPSTVRPRRVELTRAGLVESAGTMAGGATRWTISALGRQLLDAAEEARRAG